MTVDIEKLEALAKASAGEWYEVGELRYEDRKSGDLHGLHHDDERFIAAANPAAVLELTQKIRDLQSSVSGLKTGYEAYERVNAELRAENKRLKTKLETVRCLFGSAVPSDEQLDIAIDAAMSKEQSND